MEMSRVWRAKIMEKLKKRGRTNARIWIQWQYKWMRRRRCDAEMNSVKWWGTVERWRWTRGSRGDGEMDIRGRNGGGGEDSWGDGERECSASEIGVRHATVHQHHTLHLHLDQWEASVDKQSLLCFVENSQRDKEKKSLQFPDEMRCNHRNLWYSDDAIYNLKFYLKYNFQSKSDGSYEICKLSIAGMGIHCIWWRSGVTGSATVNVNNALFTLYPSYLTQQADPPAYCHMCLPSKNPCQSFS